MIRETDPPLRTGRQKMALHPDFHQWLTSRGLQPATITVLRKESILQESTLQLLTDSDLQSLKSKHGITLGQFALLRSVREDLHKTADDGFDIIELEDAPAELGISLVASGEQKGGRASKNNVAVKYRVGSGEREGTKGVLRENVEKAVERGSRLQTAAESAEGLASSASEYSRLSSMLAEKRRSEAGGGVWRRSKKTPEKTSSSSGLPLIDAEEREYDHLDNGDPQTSRRHTHPEETDRGSVAGSGGKRSNSTHLSEPSRAAATGAGAGADKSKKSVSDKNDTKCCSVM